MTSTDAYTRYIADTALPSAWLVDIDGTLALRGDSPGVRGYFEWHRVGEDLINTPVRELVRALSLLNAIVLISGRDAVCAEETRLWLKTHDIPCDDLYMRTSGDYRKDAEVKRELFETYVAARWNVRGVIDDRNAVVAMWRDLGLMCAQVAPGNF